MIEEIDRLKSEIPAGEWEATPESVRKVLEMLLSELHQMKQKIEELEEKLNKNSKNSSIPPSKSGFGSKKEEKSQPKRKPLTITKPRTKPEQKVYEAAECQELNIHEQKPSNCSNCGYELTGEDSVPHRHQVVDLPPVFKPIVDEYKLHELECEHCGEKTRATLPVGVSAKSYGARLAAFVAFLSVESRQSHRQVQAFLSQVFGIEISRGTINGIRQEVSAAIAEPTAAAMGYVQQQQVVNCDETGFSQQNRDGKNPTDKKAWIWVMVTPLVSVFIITLSRSQAVAKQLIGEAFAGFLGSDRYSSYSWVSGAQRQLCWAHLLRDFQAFADRPGVSGDTGAELLKRGYRLFHWWHRVRDGTMSRELFIEAVKLLRIGLRQELEEVARLDIALGEKTPLAKTIRTCRKLLQVESAMWTFVEREQIEPTNNSAEQALGGAVIWRGLSFGSQSQAGSEFVARMLTVNRSLKSQGRSILDFLTDACFAYRVGETPPSLIPPTQTPSTAISQTLIIS
jgi:transposase